MKRRIKSTSKEREPMYLKQSDARLILDALRFASSVVPKHEDVIHEVVREAMNTVKALMAADKRNNINNGKARP